ncbi:substance-P receptor-like [Orbicella faveolata]|uniref:substance-P receptor-like n=1 Tax=Orbicella faveolata TaxID=48498 RepID=UPI0009E1954E|nr:substance-P receptor-like [Orbicella faveolata]
MKLKSSTNCSGLDMQPDLNRRSDIPCTGNENSAPEETDIHLIHGLITAAYVIVFAASLFGNSVIIHIIRTDNSMKNTTNYLILNQACADLYRTLMESLNISSHLVRKRWLEGIVGLITCKLFLASLFIPTIFTIWILPTIAVDRFYAVIRPFRSSPLSRHFKKIILILWSWSVVCSIEVSIRGSLHKTKHDYVCDVVYTVQKWITFYILTVSLNVVLPLFITAVLYIIVCHKLWSREVPGEGTNQNQRQAEAMKTARKVTRMMITVVVLYVLCFLPFFVGNGLYHFDVPKDELEPTILFLCLFLVAFAYSGLNPYIYLTFNQKFRNGFKTLFGNCLRKIKFHNIVQFRSQSVDIQQT